MCAREPYEKLFSNRVRRKNYWVEELFFPSGHFPVEDAVINGLTIAACDLLEKVGDYLFAWVSGIFFQEQLDRLSDSFAH